MDSSILNISRGWKTAQPNYVPQTPYPGMPGTQPSKVKSNKGCWMALGCGFLFIFVMTMIFFFLVFQIADTKTSPANFITDQFLAHISAGGIEKAYDLTAPAFQEELTLEKFTKKIEAEGMDGLQTWEHQGATWLVGGEASIEVFIVSADGTSVPVLFKVNEFEGEWKITEFYKYEPE